MKMVTSNMLYVFLPYMIYLTGKDTSYLIYPSFGVVLGLHLDNQSLFRHSAYYCFTSVKNLLQVVFS